MTVLTCKSCFSAPPAVEGLCIVCAREQLPAANNPRAAGRGIQPWLRPRDDHPWRGNHQERTPDPPSRLPAGFLTTDQVAEKRGFSIRTARNRAKNHKIGIKQGREWLIYEPALDALAANDTGSLVDAQRHLETIR